MCGIVGIYNHSAAAQLAANAMFAVQHRGQEACGIAVAELFEPLQKEQKRLVGSPDYLNKVAAEGARKATERSIKKLIEVKAAVGFAHEASS